jgi:endonuclease/exonuclease/phosphatase family metal-dependent hydrolase
VTQDQAPSVAECQALAEALRRWPTLAALHAAPEWPALRDRLAAVLAVIRRHEPAREPSPPADPARLRAVQWNIEHGNAYPLIEEALRTHPELAGADLVTLDEVDLGMARSGNRDVAGALAAALGLHAAWAPLFLETTAGRDDDVRTAAGAANREALFGLAMLSRWPMRDVRLVELPGPERYQFEVERMLGGHIALVAVIERPNAPFVAVATHLEIHRTRAHRAIQMRMLLQALRDETRPLILSGDFNSTTLERGRPWDPLAGALALIGWPEARLRRRLLWPDRGPDREPLFDVLRGAGFDWESFVDREPTLGLRFARVPEARRLLAWPVARALLQHAERRARLKLDWFAARGWRGGRGATVRGLDGPGLASDHAPVVAQFW